MDDIPYVPSIADLPVTDPRCNNFSCNALYAGYNLSQATTSFALQFQYGHWLAWYYSIFIFFAILVYVSTLDSNRTPIEKSDGDSGGGGSRPTIVQKLQAYRRFITYRRLNGRLSDSLGLPSMGMLIFLVTGVVVLAVMSFAIRPYYRESDYYGSPPLAIRAGLMAASLTPLLIALGGKVNLITILTGIGYEKLNVIHRWVGWMIFGMSVIHTVPFIVAPLRTGGAALLHSDFYAMDSFQYTGIAPLAILFGIVLFSIPWIRHRFYESFYWLHSTLGVSYLGLCFWHFGNEGDSWAYLYATLAVWLFTIVGRIFYKNQAFRVTASSWPFSFPTRLATLAGGVVRIDVYVPMSVRWSPGQHFYLRFPRLSAMDNHPFTIANTVSTRTLKKEDSAESLVQRATFFARPHSGFTRRLASFASTNVDVNETVWLEGPYGGVTRDIVRRCNSLVLIAGGSGITACLPWVLHCTQRMSVAGREAALQNVMLVWIVREKAHTSWVQEELEAARNFVNGDKRLQISWYITRSSTQTQPTTVDQKGTDSSTAGDHSEKAGSMESFGTYYTHRPSIAGFLPELLGSGRNMIIGCGPESLKVDIANATADAQRRVWHGECTEVALHSESFGWG